MRAFSVLTLLCATFVIASAAKPGPALFSDWLEQMTTGIAPAIAKSASAPAYEEGEYEYGCFKEASFGHCRCIGCGDYCYDSTCNTTCCATSYSQSNLACCNTEDYGRHDLSNGINDILTNIDIGTCEFTQQFFDADVVVVRDISYKIGTFEAVCNLNHGQQCGHPFCDSMVLSWRGTYWIVLSVSKTNPDYPPFTDCGESDKRKKGARGVTGGRGASKKLQDALNALASKKAKKADVAELQYKRDRHATITYYAGYSGILEGPVSITSRKYNLKYHTGYMDFVVDWAGERQISEAAAEGIHEVVPFTYTLKVAKYGEHYTQ